MKEKVFTQHYRGTRPAVIVEVLEGNGEENPYYLAKYVLIQQTIAGISRFITLGKVVPLTEEEKRWFDHD